jgi:hypothetical protein
MPISTPGVKIREVTIGRTLSCAAALPRAMVSRANLTELRTGIVRQANSVITQKGGDNAATTQPIAHRKGHD